MRRARRWWFAGLALATVATFAGLWSVTTALRESQSRAQQSQDEFARAQTIRLALWRMDGWMTPRLVREAARPTTDYAAFFSPDDAVNRMLQAVPKGEVLAPSPLLSGSAGWILLHFEVSDAGAITSPQVPQGNLRDLAEGQYLKAGIDPAHMKQLEALRALLPVKEQALESLICQTEKSNDALAWSSENATEIAADTKDSGARQQLSAANAPAPVQTGGGLGGGASKKQIRSVTPENALAQTLTQTEFANRARATTSAQQLAENSSGGMIGDPELDLAASADRVAPARASTLPQPPLPLDAARTVTTAVSIGALVPVWIAEAPPTLALVRRVRENGATRIQGVLVDWKALSDSLLGEVSDLVEGGSVRPIFLADAGFTPTRLASIPAELVVQGVRSTSLASVPTATPAITVAWSAAMLALIAAGAATWAGVSFGDRQARFASSVTHELRTPLTTFQLYSEMLRDGMVSDETRRAQCLETLCRESHRLGHLVENVLSLARLERGASPSTTREATHFDAPALDALIHRLAAERANNIVLTSHCEFSSDAVRLDGDALSQIVGNLLENAAKYGSNGAGSIEVDVSVRLDADALVVVVEDHGRGVSPAAATAIWRPFNRGEAAQSTLPGLGIGLTVSRALAQSMGGSLRLLSRGAAHDSNGRCRGAAFELRLPCAASLSDGRVA